MRTFTKEDEHERAEKLKTKREKHVDKKIMIERKIKQTRSHLISLVPGTAKEIVKIEAPNEKKA